MAKRIISACLCLLLFFTLVQPALAADNTTPAVLYQLLKKFPDKAYWNHVGSKKNNPDGVTNSPCPSHKGCSWEEGACSCNSFMNAIQCKGFSYKAAYELIGTDPREWKKSEKLDTSKLCVGDIIRYRNDGHSATVTGVSGNIISIVDANWLPMCQIRWAQLKADEFPGFTYVLHDTKNKLKNKNVDFYLGASAKPEEALQGQTTAAEQWTSFEVLNMRKKATTDSAILCKVPSGAKLSVTSKKIAGGYLWGKTSYSASTGWVALDYCRYVSGTANAPSITSCPKIQPTGEAFSIKWKKVGCADSYTVSVYDSNKNCVAEKTTKSTSADFTLTAAGEYSATVKSKSAAAPSWVLKSGEVSFGVLNKEDIPVESVSLNISSLTLEIGEAATVVASVCPDCADKSLLVWKSSNENAAWVDSNGEVAGSGFGHADISCSDRTGKVSAVCSVNVVPAAPENVHQVTSKAATDFITLKWNKVHGADGYLVYRKNGSGAYKLIGTVDSNTFIDTPLSSSKEFVYVIKAFAVVSGTKFSGAGSDEASAATKPEKPQGLSVSSSGKTVTLKWKKSSKVSSYFVYKKLNKDGSFKKVAEVNGKSYKVNVKSGNTVYFRIRAVKKVNGKNLLSAYSGTVKLKVK